MVHESDQISLHLSTIALLDYIKTASSVVLIVGSKVRKLKAESLVEKLAHMLGCPVVVMPDGKGVFDESSVLFQGCYWGRISSSTNVETLVESADLKIFIGCTFTDGTTLGWSLNYKDNKSVIIAEDHLHIKDKRYSFVKLADLVETCSSKLITENHVTPKPTNTNVIEHIMMPSSNPEQALTVNLLQQKLQEVLLLHNLYASILCETGDSWFVGMKLQLFQNMKFHIQIKYASIGWALPASLGVGIYEKELESLVNTKKKIMLIIGDGSFQASAQELSTLVKYNIDATIILLNNGTYGIEEHIHPGTYNRISNWNYVDLINAMSNGTGSDSAIGIRAKSLQDLSNALDVASDRKGVCLIECIISPADCTEDLLIYGRHIAMTLTNQP